MATALQVLQLLRGTVPGHHLQHNPAQEDALLYGQFNHPLRRHLLPLRSSLLPALRLRGEGLAVYIHPPLSHRLLPAPRGDHPAHLHNSASPREVPPLHHAAVHAVRGDHDRRAQRQLSVAGHPQAGAVGALLLHRRPAQVPLHREAEEGRGRRQEPAGRRPQRRHTHADDRQVQVLREELRQLRDRASVEVRNVLDEN